MPTCVQASTKRHPCCASACPATHPPAIPSPSSRLQVVVRGRQQLDPETLYASLKTMVVVVRLHGGSQLVSRVAQRAVSTLPSCQVPCIRSNCHLPAAMQEAAALTLGPRLGAHLRELSPTLACIQDMVQSIKQVCRAAQH